MADRLTEKQVEARKSTARMIYEDQSRDETERGDALMDMSLCDLALQALSSRSAAHDSLAIELLRGSDYAFSAAIVADDRNKWEDAKNLRKLSDHAKEAAGILQALQINRLRTRPPTAQEGWVRVPRELLLRWGTAMPVLATMLDKGLQFGSGNRAREMQREISDIVRAAAPQEQNAAPLDNQPLASLRPDSSDPAVAANAHRRIARMRDLALEGRKADAMREAIRRAVEVLNDPGFQFFHQLVETRADLSTALSAPVRESSQCKAGTVCMSLAACEDAQICLAAPVREGVWVPRELLVRVLDSEEIDAMANASDELRAMLAAAPKEGK